MKIVFALALSLFFLVLRGKEHVHSGNYHSTLITPIQHINKLKYITSGNSDPDLQKLNSGSADDSDDTFTMDYEDDDVVFAGKNLTLEKYRITFVYAFILTYPYIHLENRLPFFGQLSYISSHKYILQRVLRV